MSNFNRFCRAVLEAIEQEPEDRPSWFKESSGLCSNASRYEECLFVLGVKCTLQEAFWEMFKAKEISCTVYPFNDGNPYTYDMETLDKAHYKNEARLEFLRKHAEL